jgi:thiol-disulfide isomerase/thioredoxin
MPFGTVFGSVFFFAMVLWALSRLPGGAWGPARFLDLVLAWTAASLAAGLLLRQAWARWSGAAVALFLSFAGAILVAARDQAMDFVVFLGALSTLVLLLVPVTGKPSGARPWRRTGRVVGWTALGALVPLAVLGGFTVRWRPVAAAGEARRNPPSEAALATSRFDWLDFAPGLERAKATGKPIFVDFYATWCGPCKMMERKTFRDAEVVRKLSGIVAVRVDSEETVPRSGERGADVAERFNVEVYPTLLVLDPEGREVSRRTGFMPPDEFAEWLATSVEKAKANRASIPRTTS